MSLLLVSLLVELLLSVSETVCWVSVAVVGGFAASKSGAGVAVAADVVVSFVVALTASISKLVVSVVLFDAEV